MTTVFVGGSRRVNRLNSDVRSRLAAIAEKELQVVVGDASGADKAVQGYFRDIGYGRVAVYCTGETCRNNLGGWPTTHVAPPSNTKRKDRAFFSLKDRAMSGVATHGLMLWDGDSVGTLANVVRLQRAQCPVVVYLSHEKRFVEVRSYKDLLLISKSGPPGILQRVEDSVASETDAVETPQGPQNLSLFNIGVVAS